MRTLLIILAGLLAFAAVILLGHLRELIR